MASRASFTISGAKELEAALKALGPEVATKAGATGTRQAANVIRDEMKDRAPKRSGPSTRTYKNKDAQTQTADYGHLVDNIKTKKVKARKLHTVSFIVSTTKAFWGRFSEYGTAHEPAKPWMRPALDSAAAKAVDALSVELKKAIDKAGKAGRR